MYLEQRQCPPEYQERITHIFGVNPYGDPLYKVAWSHSEFIRMGNIWRDSYGNERRGYRDRHRGATPCWNIMRWRSPKEYGTPTLYYMQTWDEFSKTFITGEYPWKGRYETLISMYRKQMVNGELVVESFPLSHILIDQIIPLLVEAQSLTLAERKAALQMEQEQREKEESQLTEDVLMHHLPSFYGPVSFSRQGCRTSLIDRKIEQLQRGWSRMSYGGKLPTFFKGFQVGSRPKQVN
jgi:hypothetical protein